MRIVSKYYEEALTREQDILTKLGDELHTLDTTREKDENSLTFHNTLIDKHCLLHTKLERRRQQKIEHLQELLLQMSNTFGHNNSQGRESNIAHTCPQQNRDNSSTNQVQVCWNRDYGILSELYFVGRVS